MLLFVCESVTDNVSLCVLECDSQSCFVCYSLTTYYVCFSLNDNVALCEFLCASYSMTVALCV